MRRRFVPDLTFFLVIFTAMLVGVLAGGCASVGSGDPAIVHAEDVQVNSLSFYDTAMQWHFAHSTTESPQVYKAFEVFRTSFPPAWKTLSNAIASYKTGQKADLQTALALVEQLLREIQAIWTPAPIAPTPVPTPAGGK